MKLGTVLLTVFFAVCALGATIWLGRYGDVKPVNRPPVKEPETESMPTISPTGPYPKAVVDGIVHEFGVMEVAEEKKHTFVIRNEGDAPLLLVKGKPTCKCTIGELSRSEIPPGESAEVEVTWKAVNLDEHFEQRAPIYSNDPNNNPINLTIKGRVQKAVILKPVDVWNVSDISEEKPTEVTGVLYSPVLDEFKVLGFDGSTELLSGKAIPLSPEKLKELGAKSGYSIHVSLKPEMPVGPFREKLTIRTDARDGTQFAVHIQGNRPGPLRILATPGVKWRSDVMLLNLGQFKSKTGKKATLSMFVSGLGDEEFKFLDVEADPGFLTVTLKRDPRFKAGNRKRYFVTFEVPPGSPPVSRISGSYGKVEVKTNHPQAADIKFRVQFVSL